MDRRGLRWWSLDWRWLTSVSQAVALFTLDWHLGLCFASSKPRLCSFTRSWYYHSSECEPHSKRPVCKLKNTSHSFSMAFFLIMEILLAFINNRWLWWVGTKGMGWSCVLFYGKWKNCPCCNIKGHLLGTGGPICQTQSLRHWDSAGSTLAFAIPARPWGQGLFYSLQCSSPQHGAWHIG